MITFCLILFRLLKTMVRKFILSVSQCVVDDLYKKKTLFKYVSESVVFNDYHGLKNNCSYRSGKAHSFHSYHSYHHILIICIVVDMKKYCLSFFRVTFAKVSAGFAVIDLGQHATNVLIIISCIVLEILLRYIYIFPGSKD